VRTEAVTKIAELARASGVLRPRDLKAHGIARQYLRFAEQQGLVVRSGRGLYVPADADVTEFHTFAEAAKRAPRGIICLLSALRFYNIGTQNPFEVWMAGKKIVAPAPTTPEYASCASQSNPLSSGRKHTRLRRADECFFLAKTVADCFKYRNKVGLDIAIEALRESLRNRKARIADLWEAAKVCRVANVMKPYMEALT